MSPPMQVEPERGCFRRAAGTHVLTHCASPDPAGRFLCACHDTQPASLAQDAPETARPQAGQAPLPSVCPLLCPGAALLQAGRQAGEQSGSWPCPVPGPWAPSPWLPARPLCIPHRGPPLLLLRGAGAHRLFARALQGLVEGGYVRAKTNKTPFLLVFTYVSSHLQTRGRSLPHTCPKGRRLPQVGDRLVLARSWTRGTEEHFGPDHTTNTGGGGCNCSL